MLLPQSAYVSEGVVDIWSFMKISWWGVMMMMMIIVSVDERPGWTEHV